MYLKSLTLRGFKSFASATALHFEPGITCVVGPNGSGKSNVVDALAWVMGEQGAKSLRGGKMDDVIFAGTSGRAPLGRAQVELTIDNSDGVLPIEYAEVTISRTMFRSGGSEYAINGKSCRLLDVQELLSDSGIGKEMHVIVGQGQLDSILQATPESRRGFVEEAAGVLKHRKRKEKAIRKLEATQANLDRVNDLLTEIRRQLKPLARQATVARKAAVIQAEYRDAKARLLADDVLQAQLALESDHLNAKVLQQATEEVEAKLQTTSQALDSAQLQLTQVSKSQQENNEVYYQLVALRERIISTASIAAERTRMAHKSVSDVQPHKDPNHLESQAQLAEKQEALALEQVQLREADFAHALQVRKNAEAEYEAQTKLAAAQMQEIANRREKLARVQGKIQSLQVRIESHQNRIQELNATQATNMETATATGQEYAQIEAEIAQLKREQSVADEEYQKLSAQLQDISTKYRQLRNLESDSVRRQGALSAKLDFLRTQLASQDAGLELLQNFSHLIAAKTSDELKVAPGWETAVAALLSEWTTSVLVETPKHALEILSGWQTEAQQVNVLFPSQVDQATLSFKVAKIVQGSPQIMQALAPLLHDVAFCEDLGQAQQLMGKHRRIVTRRGDVISDWGAKTGKNEQASMLKMASECEVIQAQLAEQDQQLLEFKTQLTLVEENQKAKQLELTQSAGVAQKVKAQISVLQDQLKSIDKAQAKAAMQQEQNARNLEQARQRLDADQKELQEQQSQLQILEQSAQIEPPDPQVQTDLQRQAQTARQLEMDAKLALRTAQDHARSFAGRADSLRRQAVQERQLIQAEQRRRHQLEAEIATASAISTACQYLLQQTETSVAQAQQQRSVDTQKRTELETLVQDLRQQASQAQSERERLKDQAHLDEVARTQLKLKFEQLAGKSVDELGLNVTDLLAEYGPEQLIPVLVYKNGEPVDLEDPQAPAPVPYVRTEQERRLKHALQQITALGKVNPLALEEYEAMQERHAFISKQLDDVQRTRADLEQIIQDVDKRVEQVFAAAYQDVERAFEQVFSRLFPGGEGRLVLTEPGQWLTTGIEVEARPAGKKVKRLSLLSGGERSLVAVAFLISLFIARPSPFYILDEVEAALDDTNLGRLLDIYEQLRESSQLLIITHHKRTMEIADALYGVTMHGDGVSTVISQKL